MKKKLKALGMTALLMFVPAVVSAQQDAVTVTANGVNFKMIKVDGGTFTMGINSSDPIFENERPAHKVTLSTYYIGETEVTQELWMAVMGKNPSRFAPDRQATYVHCGYSGFVADAQKINAAMPGSVRIPSRQEWDEAMVIGGSMQRPVEWVSWAECQEFVERLSELTGKKFRLPTEAEWEYAARGGKKSRGYLYSGSNDIDDVAWYEGNTNPKDELHPDYGTHPVRSKQPNELGIYDMTGNVYEWCQDVWAPTYPAGAQTNPKGPKASDKETSRLMRGGGWLIDDFRCRTDIRNINHLEGKDNNIGLRLVMEP